MIQNLKTKIERAKELLSTVRHASMATVNIDGSPHNTPFLFLHDPKLKYVYWVSHLESQHSINISRTGQIFVVLYDAIQRGGLYIKAEKGHVLSGQELEHALLAHNEFRSRQGLEPLEINNYADKGPQRMWSAKITNLWVNKSERDFNDRVIRDLRVEITAKDLLG